MEWFTNPEIWIAFFTLTALEIVLGIDNIIMISILVSRMPKHMQARTRIFGLALAMVTRILLLLSHFGKNSTTETVVAGINQEHLAQMVGTTRSRINYFMNRFRKLGFITYNTEAGLLIHRGLRTVVSSEA